MREDDQPTGKIDVWDASDDFKRRNVSNSAKAPRVK